MKYRVTIDVAFSDEKDVLSFVDLVKTMKDKIEPAVEAMSMSAKDATLVQPMTVKYHRCYHDEATPKPCDGYVTVDIKG